MPKGYGGTEIIRRELHCPRLASMSHGYFSERGAAFRRHTYAIELLENPHINVNPRLFSEPAALSFRAPVH